jgi:manganese efflux pump family protein
MSIKSLFPISRENHCPASTGVPTLQAREVVDAPGEEAEQRSLFPTREGGPRGRMGAELAGWARYVPPYSYAVPGLVSLLLVSVSVGLSNFAGAIGIGLSGISVRTRIRVGIAFGLFEAAMPIAGLLLGEAVAGVFGHYGKYVGGAILVITGLYTIAQGRRTVAEEKRSVDIRTHRLLITAMALSIDNLAVGFALAIYHIQIVLAASIMGIVSVGMSLAGLELGSRLGARVEAWSEELSGGVLILVGAAIAVGVFG